MTSYNKLKDENSPYLKQHADNPVNWYPWGEEAFKLAKDKNLPIFLSIGYSTCHWCHVMEKESFEDEEVAQMLNQFFISIKVDREERPEIDSLYMDVCQTMTGSGGWPLSIFMTADKKPFYAATYIPKENKYGRKGLLTILPEIHYLWTEERKKLLQASENIVSHLSKINQNQKAELASNIFEKTVEAIESNYDHQYGGFGSSPKFPMYQYLLFLLHYWKKTGEDKYLSILETTLQQMRAGGIYDQLAFGFHRYSTDREWKMPHFEKMLYDQALMIYIYTAAYQATAKEIYADVVKEIVSFLESEMLAKEGAFFTAIDADSGGEEGKYYLWEKSELKSILNEAQFNRLNKIFDIQANKNINLSLKNVQDYNQLAELKDKLLKHRKERIHPSKDKKILTDWNGLLIAALAKAGFVLKEDRYLKLADDVEKFIHNNMKTNKGRLAHSYYEGEKSKIDNLNDYSFLLWGLIELYQATLKDEYLIKAEKTAKIMKEYFWDQKEEAFYFSAKDNEDLFIKQINANDHSLPSANSIAAFNFLKLAHLKDNLAYQKDAQKIIAAFSDQINKAPSNYIFLVLSNYYFNNPFIEIKIHGDKKYPLAQELIENIRDRYLPDYLIKQQKGDKNNKLSLCKDFVCGIPTDKLNDILKELN
ncbi:putative glutamate--cysteine ligase/putative amino acid ligase [Halanaerobium hydrogeniformans]|uniref:Glutamate--cysteine ligase/putative amino acid ligase n=1 Tax=Halanaerobium hydrogeniformans TaxID=656519 RepID=E4RK75_HALHG|nr:thioredoxin domain-containing protein [Halanaerobium hydrogeniformans]ADQ14627.1 putative glutamate--cysteine ligase/putative amino acid ligase [Halanaerobium hydrogeniformans]